MDETARAAQTWCWMGGQACPNSGHAGGCLADRVHRFARVLGDGCGKAPTLPDADVTVRALGFK
jgi:hypothetical protein